MSTEYLGLGEHGVPKKLIRVYKASMVSEYGVPCVNTEYLTWVMTVDNVEHRLVGEKKKTSVPRVGMMIFRRWAHGGNFAFFFRKGGG